MEENVITMLSDNILQYRDLNGDSVIWANWMSQLTLFTCLTCAQQHGTIVDISMLKRKTQVDAHKNCQCEYVPMRTKRVGTVTDLGMDGADVYLYLFNSLPEYYVSFEVAKDAGWSSKKGNLDKVLPGKMIGGAVCKNKDGKLPQSVGRIWYEADINYDGGYRNRNRILYSNDG